MVISTEVPQVVVHRFPHLGDQIVARAAADVNFLSLCGDYSALITTLASVEGGTGERGAQRRKWSERWPGRWHWPDANWHDPRNLVQSSGLVFRHLDTSSSGGFGRGLFRDCAEFAWLRDDFSHSGLHRDSVRPRTWSDSECLGTRL